MAFKWTKALAVGVEEIDNQHKELFEKVNELVAAMREKKGKEVIKETMVFMENYVVKHFLAEEKLMKKFDYPGYEDQHEEHQKFVNEITEFANEIKYVEINSNFIVHFELKIGNWLLKHTSTIDRELGEFLIEKGFT